MPNSYLMYCAPGTWQSWQLADGSQTQVGGHYKYYIFGDITLVDRWIGSLLESEFLAKPDVNFKSSFLAKSGFRPLAFFGDKILIFGFVAGLMLFSAMGLSRWLNGITQTLSRAGFQAGRLIRVSKVSVLFGSLLVSVIGGIIGSVINLPVRPLLKQLNSQKPLSPWYFPILEIAVIAIIASLAANLGVSIGLVWCRVRLRQQTRSAVSLSPRQVRISATIAELLIGVAFIVLFFNASKYLNIVIGALGLLLGLAALAPWLLTIIGVKLALLPVGGKRADRQVEVTPQMLAGRLLLEDSRRWSVSGVALTLMVGLLVTVFLNASASVAGQVALTQSAIPAGMMVVHERSHDGAEMSDETRNRLETDLDLKQSIELFRLDLIATSGQGAVVAFDTVADATRLLALTESDQAFLRSGGILQIGLEATDQDFKTDSGQSYQIPAKLFKPDVNHRLALGAGFVAKESGAIPVEIVEKMWVYYGLSPDQDTAARNWPTASGISVFQIDTFYHNPGFSLPIWVAVSMSGLALLVMPFLVGVLQREIRNLRPVAAGLQALGMPPQWIGRTIRTLTLIVLGLAVGLSAVAAIGSISLLALRAPAAYDLYNLPWWIYGTFLATLFAVSLIAATLATRRLRFQEAKLTI